MQNFQKNAKKPNSKEKTPKMKVSKNRHFIMVIKQNSYFKNNPYMVLK